MTATATLPELTRRRLEWLAVCGVNTRHRSAARVLLASDYGEGVLWNAEALLDEAPHAVPIEKPDDPSSAITSSTIADVARRLAEQLNAVFAAVADSGQLVRLDREGLGLVHDTARRALHDASPGVLCTIEKDYMRRSVALRLQRADGSCARVVRAESGWRVQGTWRVGGV